MYMDKDGALAHRLTRQVSLILYIVDGFTNEPVRRGSAFARIEGAAAPIVKDGGYFVFMDMPPGEYTVHVFGNTYQPVDVAVSITGDLPSNAVQTLRLMPGINYRLPASAVRLFGTAHPGSLVRAVFTPDKKTFKLLYDYEPGSVIRIFCGETKVLDGYSFCIADEEYLTVAATLDADERVYLLTEPLKGTYKKGVSRLTLVSAVRADAAGKFYITLDGMGDKPVPCMVKSDGQCREVFAAAGAHLQVDFI